MIETALRRSADAVLLDVVVVPGAAHTETGDVDPWRHALRIRVAAKAEGGAANDELVRFLAERLGVPRSSVRIASGARSRRKRIVLGDIVMDEAVRRLEGGL